MFIIDMTYYTVLTIEKHILHFDNEGFTYNVWRKCIVLNHVYFVDYTAFRKGDIIYFTIRRL